MLGVIFNKSAKTFHDLSPFYVMLQVEAGEIYSSPVVHLHPTGYTPLATAVPIESLSHVVSLGLTDDPQGSSGRDNSGTRVAHFAGGRQEWEQHSYPFAHAVTVQLD